MMGKRYYVLLVQETAGERFGVQFGDYENYVVKDEYQEYRDKGYKPAQLQVLGVEGDTQNEIDIAVNRFNQMKGITS